LPLPVTYRPCPGKVKYTKIRVMKISTLFDEFCDNYEWLVSVARPAEGNRFADVKSQLENVARNYDADTNRITKEFPAKDLFLTAFEAKRFNMAIGYLRTLNRHHLPIAKIRSMCKGPQYHVEEIASIGNSEGRDIQFEFIVSAFLEKSGFQVREFDDIQISYASSLIRFECKRPASKRNVGARFGEAVSQLEGKIESQENEYGIVALSAEKMGNFDENFFVGDDINAANNMLIQIKNAVVQDLRPSLRISARKKILGVHLFVSTFLWDRASGNFMDVVDVFTEKAIQQPSTPLHDYLFGLVTQGLEKGAGKWTY